MNIDEINKKFFGKDFDDSYKKNRDKIIEALKNCNDEFILDILDIPFDEIKNKRDNPNYEYKDLLKIENGHISIAFITQELIDDIKNYLPKTIKKIHLPKQLLDDNFSLLNDFYNLDTLYTYKVDKDLLDKLYSNTKIKNIFVDNSFSINIENGLIVEENNHIGLYNDIYVKTIGGKDNNFDSIYILSNNKNIKEIDHFYNMLNLNQIPSEIKIGTKDNLLNYTFLFNEKNVIIEFKDDNLDNIKKLYDYFTNKGFNVESIEIDTKNIKNLYDYDYSFLDTIGDIIEVNNHSLDLINYTEFKSQIEGIKWFKKIILQSDLSPLEKLIYAYDIMKTFRYKESDESHSISRNPGKILNSDYIVCVGYVEMLDEILKGIDDDIKHIDVSVSCYDDKGEFLGGHARSLVYINDDKYNIHGPFIVDSTWDSTKEHKNAIEKYGSDYNALDLYKYFLVPMCDYKKVFPNDSVPSIFNDKSLNDNLNDKSIDEFKKEFILKKEEIEREKRKNKFFFSINDPENDLLSYDIRTKMFKNIPGIQVLDSFKNKRISFSKLLEAIRNTRLHEGFTLENVDKEMEKVSRINAPFYDDGFVLNNENIIEIK